ncbi:MAG: hypothetical protein JXR80_01465 [Deltaproteobacteria bacterium]|nr:hypothetical protein [Deltaproteobacteria bacterium]
MIFNLRRYIYALTQHLHWLGLALIPLATYLLITGIKADRFTLTRSLQINPDYPAAVTTSPVDTISLKSLVTSQNHFFTDQLALASWKRFAETDPGLAKYNFKEKNTMLTAIESLSLNLTKDNRLQLSYFGRDAELGIELVNYYMNRLLSRLRAGYHRQPENSVTAHNFTIPEELQLDRTELKRTEHHAWWRGERLGAAAIITLLPFLAALVIIGFREFLDPSFKSGRQAARYLNLPILGFIPSLDPIINNLQEGKSRSDHP